MAGSRLSLHYRILIPFALVALLATGVTAYVALQVAIRAVQARVQGQISNAVILITQGDFAANPTILRSVKAIAGAEVLTFDEQGRILASTFERGDPLAQLVVDEAIQNSVVPRDLEDATLAEISCEGRCAVAYRRLPADPSVIVGVMATASEIQGATRTVTRTIIIAALLSLTALIAVSYVVAGRISTPLDALVRFTHDVSVGSVGAAAPVARAPVGTDEVGRLSAAFNQMLERLERSQSALVKSEKLGLAGLMAARVAHDIRNPLSSIKMRTQLLDAQLAEPRQRADLAAVQHDIVTIEAVIRDLIEVARPSDVRLRPESLNDLVRALVDHVSPQFAHRRIRIELALAPSLPLLMLDAERFKGALLNVILNAADAMSSGGTLVIRSLPVDGGAVLEVSDDGTGIDAAIIERVFDPFVSTKRDGVGLGLVNTKAVVESHGGTVTLLPRTPRGTTATIRLPLPPRSHS
jgi:signal transduction histidine kinase